jgi:hypothetical protein
MGLSLGDGREWVEGGVGLGCWSALFVVFGLPVWWACAASFGEPRPTRCLVSRGAGCRACLLRDVTARGGGGNTYCVRPSAVVGLRGLLRRTASYTCTWWWSFGFFQRLEMGVVFGSNDWMLGWIVCFFVLGYMNWDGCG